MIELKDIAYGSDERQKLDAYLVGSADKMTPVLLFFHGGGYRRGDKSGVQTLELYERCLEAGISVVSCNYRFIMDHPFPAPMEDGTRAIQFVKSMASQWHIDVNRVALSGSSAGAHISLWNAFKGNLAKDDSQDPIETISSEVQAAVVFQSQVSKDQRFYDEYYLGDQVQPNLAMFYGADTLEELETPAYKQLAYDASAINFVTEEAPPVLLSYRIEFTEPLIPADASISDVIHHPVHGYVLKKKMDALGRPCVFRHAGNPLQEGELIKFLADSLSLNKEMTEG